MVEACTRIAADRTSFGCTEWPTAKPAACLGKYPPDSSHLDAVLATSNEFGWCVSKGRIPANHFDKNNVQVDNSLAGKVNILSRGCTPVPLSRDTAMG